jgi:succinate dehydrogenase / fumarate reductase, iron-sulfur subunit
MSDVIIARLFRFDPDRDTEPHYRDYHVAVEGETSALVLLNTIQKEIDPTLSFRSFCCGLQRCGSCLIRINGRKAFACVTTIRPGERVVLEPASYPEDHIKDLVVHMGQAQAHDQG